MIPINSDKYNYVEGSGEGVGRRGVAGGDGELLRNFTPS